jgi:hypothetical protein
MQLVASKTVVPSLSQQPAGGGGGASGISAEAAFVVKHGTGGAHFASSQPALNQGSDRRLPQPLSTVSIHHTVRLSDGTTLVDSTLHR